LRIKSSYISSLVSLLLRKDVIFLILDQFLLDHGYKVLVYNGQEDIILAGPQALELCLQFKWNGASQYSKARKSIWKVVRVSRTLLISRPGLSEILLELTSV